MKPRNYILANVAKNDPTRYHTRSVESEHEKLSKNRARRKSQDRKEISDNQRLNSVDSGQSHCGVTQAVKGADCGSAIHGFEFRTSP